jgi:hypothetical protein
MKNVFFLFCLMIFVFCNAQKDNDYYKNHISVAVPSGQRYINFLRQLESSHSILDLEALFSIDVKKIINSKIICTNRDQLIEQIQHVTQVHGNSKVNLLELIVSSNPLINIIRFEITWKDNTTDCVITVLKCNEFGLIEEINEVLGEKETYQWKPSNGY